MVCEHPKFDVKYSVLRLWVYFLNVINCRR